jgi:hypothetical protein
VYVPTDDVEITPGMRADFFRSAGASKTAIDPRLSMRFKITDRINIVHAYGIAHQAPSFVVPVPGLVPSSLADGLQTAWQASAGAEVALPDDVSLTATVFGNLFFDMTDAIGAGQNTGSATGVLNTNRSDGRGIGVEFFARRRLTSHLGGFLSYTLSRSTRTVDGATYPATFDRTHVASAAVAYDLGWGWRGGARFFFYTGAPQLQSSRGLLPPPPTISPNRDPAFYRLDFRLEKRWTFGERAWLAFVVEMLNATMHKETINGQEVGPVSIPSIGLEGAL